MIPNISSYKLNTTTSENLISVKQHGKAIIDLGNSCNEISLYKNLPFENLFKPINGRVVLENTNCIK